MKKKKKIEKLSYEKAFWRLKLHLRNGFFEIFYHGHCWPHGDKFERRVCETQRKSSVKKMEREKVKKKKNILKRRFQARKSLSRKFSAIFCFHNFNKPSWRWSFNLRNGFSNDFFRIFFFSSKYSISKIAILELATEVPSAILLFYLYSNHFVSLKFKFFFVFFFSKFDLRFFRSWTSWLSLYLSTTYINVEIKSTTKPKFIQTPRDVKRVLILKPDFQHYKWFSRI